MANGQKILVIDDSGVQRQQLRTILEGTGFTVLEAEDGVQGIEMIRLNQDVVMIFCDVNMPNKDGLQLVEELRSEIIDQKKLKYIPVVMLTTEADRFSISRGKAAGVAGWLIKPAKDEHIAKLVHVFAK